MIDIKEKIMVNGLLQTIHIKGFDEKNPVVLFLHGGPGETCRHAIMSKENDDLFKDFTMAIYDQRGTGGSYKGAKDSDLTISQLTDDARAIVDYLCDRLHKEKILLVGFSWGSFLGANLIYSHPERIAGFIGAGQLINTHESELISYSYTLEKAKEAGSRKDIESLERIGPPVDGMYKNGMDGIFIERKIMNRYNTLPGTKQVSIYRDLIKPVLLSGEYSLSDLYGLLKGVTHVPLVMWEEIGKIKLDKTHLKFKIPYFIFNGVYDKNTAAELIEGWYDKIEAPEKGLYWFEHSGHDVVNGEPEKFKRLFREIFLKIAHDNNL